MQARIARKMEALVEGVDRGLLVLRLKRGGKMHVAPQKGLAIGDQAFIILEPFSNRIAEVLTLSEYNHSLDDLPHPEQIDPELLDDISQTEDSTPDEWPADDEEFQHIGDPLEEW